MMSVANLSVIPQQDILSLGGEARMNNPAASSNNWQWRATPQQLNTEIFRNLLEMTETSQRC